MRYIIEYSDVASYLLGREEGMWQVYAETDSRYESNVLEEEARRDHPHRRIRVRVEPRQRADLDG